MSVSPVCNLRINALSSASVTCFIFNPVSATCVIVTSLSAPNPNTAESLSNFKSLLIVTAVDALRSIVASPSILSTPSELCCTKLAASPKVNLLVLFKVKPVPSVWVSVTSWSSPNLITAESLSRTISSPIHISLATPTPPATVNAAVPVALASVVADKATTPADDICIFEVAVSLAPVAKTSLVALLVELKSPSESADISAPTSCASPPCASSGA